MHITLTVTTQEAQAILNVLGQLPTSSGAFPLLQKLSDQAQAQVNQQPAHTTESYRVPQNGPHDGVPC